jgi:hypothetical protein
VVSIDLKAVRERILKYNSPTGRTIQAFEKVVNTAWPAGTNLVVEFAKCFVGLSYGDNGMSLDRRADCSQFWINVLYYWFGINDIGSYTEALYGAKRGRHIQEKDIRELVIILYKLSSRNPHATHAAGYLGGGLMGDTRSVINPFKVRSFNWKKDKITAFVDFLTEEQRQSVIVQSEAPATPKPDTKPVEEVYEYTGASYTNIRTGPGTKYADIGNIGHGGRVTKLGEKGSWWNIRHHASGKVGWCANTNLFKKV